MKFNIKLFTGVLLCCAVVLAFTACAGCISTNTSEDTIIGAWKTEANDVPRYLEFNADGILTLKYDVGLIEVRNVHWDKIGYNHYRVGGDDLYLDNTENQLTWKMTRSDSESKSETYYVRISQSEVPAATIPVDILGTWVGNTENNDIIPIYEISEHQFSKLGISNLYVTVNEIHVDNNGNIIYDNDGKELHRMELRYIGNNQYNCGSYLYTVSEDGKTMTVNPPYTYYYPSDYTYVPSEDGQSFVLITPIYEVETFTRTSNTVTPTPSAK